MDNNTTRLLDRIATIMATMTGEEFWDIEQAYNINMSFSLYYTTFIFPTIVTFLIKVIDTWNRRIAYKTQKSYFMIRDQSI